MSTFSQIETIQADLGGGFDRVPELAEKTTEIRTTLRAEAEKCRALASRTLPTSALFMVPQPRLCSRAASQQLPIRAAQDWHHCRAPVGGKDGRTPPSPKVAVVTGFDEVGPWGSARTRGEQESRGELTIEGIIEMAWMMGMIRHVNGKLKNSKAFFV
ncbi:fatty acid synthase alpha subunit Lsd1 [Tilletia horrida]|uniref:Fatty acid synthase alpha subunit Lsd1 n=1 Tax=Tilletia horrida TaxID=155126 RepID=A0AAN6JQ56_9BASI|nr:fatty acid synthase alpha subunit Lsd1 [Tilletia horrida]